MIHIATFSHRELHALGRAAESIDWNGLPWPVCVALHQIEGQIWDRAAALKAAEDEAISDAIRDAEDLRLDALFASERG